MNINPQPILHIIFGDSAAGSLKQAIEQAGRADKMISHGGGYGFGPINPPDPALRIAWTTSELGWEFHYDDPQRDQNFWHDLDTAGNPLIVWTSQRSVHDYTGFLEVVWRLGDKLYDVIDITDTILPGYTARNGKDVLPYQAVNTGTLAPSHFFRCHISIKTAAE